jgi:hypothetical protein
MLLERVNFGGGIVVDVDRIGDDADDDEIVDAPTSSMSMRLMAFGGTIAALDDEWTFECNRSITPKIDTMINTTTA